MKALARGRFVWDPDMEEFPLFAKSVLESCKEVMTDHDATITPVKVKDIFHLMMQEYILPADAARKIGKMIRKDSDREVYSFSGFIKDVSGTRREPRINCGEPLNIYLLENRAVVEEVVTGRMLGSISFDEDELYYVALPLLEDMKVQAHALITKVEKSRRFGNRMNVVIELAIPKDLKDVPVSNGRIIERLIRTYCSCMT